MPVETQTMERRARGRLKCNETALWRNRLTPHATIGKVVDMNRLGLQMVVDRSLGNAADIQVAIKDPKTNVWLPEIGGRLVWEKKEGCDDSDFPFAVGVRFDAPIDLKQGELDTVIASLELSLKTGRFVDGEEGRIPSSYNGSTNTFKILRAFGWGPLVNLGYYKMQVPFTLIEMLIATITGQLVNLVPEAQNRLVYKTLKETSITSGDNVLDIGCGRGRSSFIAASMHPDADITGIDLLNDNVTAGRTLYGGARNLRYLVDDAMNLSFGDSAFERVYCLEAAFHFPDRKAFLQEAYRVLKPGGKLVVVDFMWKNDKSRSITSSSLIDLVKGIWSFNDFWTVQEYSQAVKEVGFEVETSKDWSRKVTAPAVFLFRVMALIGNIRLGRYLLGRLNPVARGLNRQSWRVFRDAAAGHVLAEREVNYISLVLKKRNK